MEHKLDVRPITYLKNNTADLIREVAENRRTVLITQNGEAKAVVMDVGVYDRWKSAFAMLKILAHAETEFETGKTVSQKDAFDGADAAIRRAEDSPPDARRLLARLRTKAASVERDPRRGRVVPELASSGVRTRREPVVRPYRMVYRIQGDTVLVAAVLDGRRDLEELLLERLTRVD